MNLRLEAAKALLTQSKQWWEQYDDRLTAIENYLANLGVIQDTIAPYPVSNVAVDKVSFDSVWVSWVRSTSFDVANVEIAYSSDNGATYTVATGTLPATTLNYTIIGLNELTNYFVRIVCIDGAGNRSIPKIISVATIAMAVDGGTFKYGGTTLLDAGIFLGIPNGDLIDGGTFVDGQTAPQTRPLTGMSLNRSTDSIEVGQNFAVMATPLPYDVLYDDVVIWETSDSSICTVRYGVLEGVSQGNTTITAYDATRTYSASFDVNVVLPVSITFLPSEIYTVNASDYGIYLDNTNSIATTTGIMNALSFASQNGYKKVVFPYGTYSLNPTVGTINIPTNMVVDFSDSDLHIVLTALTNTGYTMFRMDQAEYTKLVRAHVYGEADSTTLDNSSEKCISLMISDCYKSGFESCTFSKSPGFNVSTETQLVKEGTGDNVFPYTDFEAGNIDDTGNNDDSVTDFHFRSTQYVDISTLGDYYMVGYNQGYWDYQFMHSRLYSIFFYDVNYQFIEVQHYNWQYYNYDKPANAAYCKIVIYQDFAPNNGDTDYGGAIAFIRTMGVPRDCSIKNSVIEDNWSTGLAMVGGQNWTIDGNTFSRNYGRAPSCDIDWEDGWDAMVGDIVKNNTFNSMFAITLSAGANISIFNNTFNNAAMDVWSRTQNWRIFNNTFNGKSGPVGQFDIALATAGDSYFEYNTLKGIRYSAPTKNDPGAAYAVHLGNNILQ